MKDGEKYFQRERERTKSYYKPVAEKTKKEVMSRREKVREWVRRHREKKKKENLEKLTNKINEEQVNEISSSSDILVVKLPCLEPKSRTGKRISRANAKNHREIKNLKTDNSNLQRKYKTISKRFERYRKRKENGQGIGSSNSNNSNEMNEKEIDKEKLTPRKRTSLDLSEEGLTSRKVPKTIKHKLLLANIHTNEIQDSFKKSSNRGKSAVCNMIAEKLVTKYRVKRVLGLKTNIRRQSLNDSTKSLMDGKQWKFRKEKKHRILEIV